MRDSLIINDEGAVAEDLCELGQDEGREMDEEVHIPAESSMMNARNHKVMLSSKPQMEINDQNNPNVEIRFVDRVVFV